MKIVRAIGWVAASVVLLVEFLCLTGAHAYDIPLLSPIGSTAVSVLGPWLVVVPLLIGALCVRRRASLSRGILFIVIVAATDVAWASVTYLRTAAEFHKHDVPIDVMRAFGVGVLPGWRPDEDLAYGTWQDQTLRLIVYKPKAVAPGTSAPVMLYIHGGGWTLGDKFESGTNLRWFADRGWLVMSIDYTLSAADRHLWDVTTGQVACAMIWTVSHAAQYGGDASRLSLVGSSAGGNLAINAAYLANAGRLKATCDGTAPHVSAVSALYPPVDLAAAWDSTVPVISDMARKFNGYYLGGSPRQFPERYQFVSSSAHITASAPPTLIIYGENDHLVPPDATAEFSKQAQHAGIDMLSIRFPYGDHAFNLNQYGLGNQFYLGMTEQFLCAHQ
jgi:acetyl esterase